ncbi:MAG: response regulator [Nitrospira sp.]|nr:response regulator [Nitrospira sp.]
MAASVLVIDNDPQVREFLCTTLASDGYAAAGVSSYPEAIARLQKNPVDLAITDGFTALGLAGVSALHRLFPALRLLVMSGSVSDYASVPFSSRLLSILPKPCPVRTILRVVSGALMPTTVDPMQDILERGRFDVLTTLALSQERDAHGANGPGPIG